MRIVIVGAGAVGSYLAQRLSLEGQDVVVIESDAARAAESQEALDVLVMTGNGANPAVLTEAGVDQAELLIAVSNNDGVNLLACHAAGQLGVKRTVARVEDPGLRAGMEGINVDVVIDPAETAAHELVHLVQQGGVSDLIEFCGGRLVLVGGVVQRGSWIAGSTLADLRDEISHFDWVAAVIVRHGDTTVAKGDTRVMLDDHVLMMVSAGHVDDAAQLLGLKPQVTERVVVLGSTHLAELTAAEMGEAGLEVVIVDPDQGRCRALAESNAKALVVAAELTDPRVMRELGLDERDAVLALSGWDEQNILACLLARSMGVATTVARINRQELLPLLGDVAIGATVSSRLAAANAILRFVRRGRIHSVVTFADTDAEAMEIEVAAGSRAAGQALADLDLPNEAVIGGILRKDTPFVPTGFTIIEVGDRVIIFALPAAIEAVEQLFAE